MKILLFPFTVLYAMGIGIRNLCYNMGVCKSRRYETPIILIGNLSVGGTGKTPHIEMLAQLLSTEKIQTAILSRGYGRKTRGTLEITTEHAAWEAGDEPRQIKHKFPGIPLFVDGDRRRGIKAIHEKYPDIKIILMDDGFQHRKVKPGLSLLLRDYTSLDEKQFLLPMGRLREPESAAKRADHLIITKTPEFFSPMEKRIIKKEVKKHPDQEVFFTYMHYGDLHSLAEGGKPSFFNMEYYAERDYQAFLFAGIAKPEPLEEHLQKHFKAKIHSVFFPDHHRYRIKDIEKLLRDFQALPAENKIIITTEKDAMRLYHPDILPLFHDIPIFFLPIEVRFHHEEKAKFAELIRDYLRKTYPVNIFGKMAPGNGDHIHPGN